MGTRNRPRLRPRKGARIAARPRPRVVEVAESSYQPSKAELEEDICAWMRVSRKR